MIPASTSTKKKNNLCLSLRRCVFVLMLITRLIHTFPLGEEKKLTLLASTDSFYSPHTLAAASLMMREKYRSIDNSHHYECLDITHTINNSIDGVTSGEVSILP